jgi:hypothetical protein
MPNVVLLSVVAPFLGSSLCFSFWPLLLVPQLKAKYTGRHYRMQNDPKQSDIQRESKMFNFDTKESKREIETQIF